ncbi:protein Teyrha-meyrha isoform X2 [Hermetia illucens]|uniref:protein Teyrha-meyrha isoform X2 n=1 Tax=Hermetia illucens TaxID=343691 RepID=UPI0018CC3F68|nr:protein Teyrha-meyrha isoform X2 [Hermetia illucens]
MENTPFGANHLPSQALVVLSEAASGLHEALRNQRTFHSRLPDAKDLHNMSLVGNYGSHLLHTFHPHLIQSLNSNILGNSPGNFFANDRTAKPILSNFQLPSAFSPPKYIGISLDQGLFSGSGESFRTDSTSPTCASISPLTKNDSLEGQVGEYDGDKGESPRSNSDPRDFRHPQNKNNGGRRSSVPESCPVCGIQLSVDEWNTHFLSELDRLYKLSSGMDRSNIQQNYLMGSCPNQDNGMRTSHNRWETFQRIRTNRQSRLRIKVRRRKCGNDLYFLENLFCNSCPICRRKFSAENAKNYEEEQNVKDEMETVDVESCSDDVPDSGSDISNVGKVAGVLYKSVCLLNKDSGDDPISSWDPNSHMGAKNASELSSTTPQFYNADSCEDGATGEKDDANNSNNDSDEDLVVDDDCVRVSRKRKLDGDAGGTDNNNTEEDRQSEPQVSSTDPTETSKCYPGLDDLRTRLKELDPTPMNRPKEEEDYKCFICKTGLENYSNFFRGRSLYFHQSCANVMSSCRNFKAHDSSNGSV